MGSSTFSGPIKSGPTREGASANVGSVVLRQTNTLTFADTVAKTLFYLPANAKIIDVYVDVQTAFNSTGTDLVTVGTAADTNAFADAVDVSTAGRKLGSADTTVRGLQYAGVGTADIAIQGLYTQSIADATAGAANITVLYVQA